MQKFGIPLIINSLHGVIGCGEGVVYRASPGRPTDIGLQLGKTCYPCKRVRGGGGGGMFLFLLFLHFHSDPLFRLCYCLFSLFFISLGDNTK